VSLLHHYAACGLTVASDAPIPGLRAAVPAGSPDLYVAMSRSRAATAERVPESIRYASPDQDDSGAHLLTVWTRADGGHRLRYSDGTEFLVDSSARRIDIRWEAPLTGADACVYLLGPVLGFVMRLRGIVPLHASAVAIGGAGVLFTGGAGAGKSTTAASFAALGFPCLSDDVVPVADAAPAMLAFPSHQRLTVWPESAEGLFGSADALPPLSETYEKRYLQLEGRYQFQATPVPIEVIYVLAERSPDPHALGVRRLSPRAALMTLLGNTYCSYLIDGPMRANEFDLLSRIARQVPVRELTFGDGLAHLPRLCQRLAMSVPMEAAALES
jgi:hypothetical protein